MIPHLGDALGALVAALFVLLAGAVPRPQPHHRRRTHLGYVVLLLALAVATCGVVYYLNVHWS